MPTTRRRRARSLIPGLTPFQRAWLLDADLPDMSDEDRWWRYVIQHHDYSSNYSGRLWAEHEHDLLLEFTAAYPGCRPRTWWKFSAPRAPIGSWPGRYYDGQLELPRERLGGIGTPKHEALAYVPSFTCGIPSLWVTRSEVAHYARPDLGYRSHFSGVAIDPCDPPRFEAQAAYLRRHGLFLPGEERRLKKADFEPELVDAPEDERLLSEAPVS